MGHANNFDGTFSMDHPLNMIYPLIQHSYGSHGLSHGPLMIAPATQTSIYFRDFPVRYVK